MKSLSRVVLTAFLALLAKDGKDGSVEAQSTTCILSEESDGNYLWKTPEFGKAKYVTDFNCTFASSISQPRVVKYHMTSFEIQGKTRDKCRDKVRFYKPYDRNIKICGSQTGRDIIIPMGMTYAQFYSNHRKGAPGFNINITASTDNTGVINLNSAGTPSYNLLSPGYPIKVVDHAGEYWFTTDEVGKELQMSIDVDIKKTRCCRKDYVVVSPRGDPLYPRSTSRIFCGIKRTSITSKGQKMYVSLRAHHRANLNLTVYMV